MFDSSNNYLLAFDQSFFRCPWETLRNLVNIKCNLQLIVIFIYLLFKMITQVAHFNLEHFKTKTKRTTSLPNRKILHFCCSTTCELTLWFFITIHAFSGHLIFLEVDSMADKVVYPTNQPLQIILTRALTWWAKSPWALRNMSWLAKVTVIFFPREKKFKCNAVKYYLYVSFNFRLIKVCIFKFLWLIKFK